MEGAAVALGPSHPVSRSSRIVSRFGPARLLTLALLVAAALLVGSCSNTHHLNIESDTCWLMVIDGQTEAVERVANVGQFPWGTHIMDSKDNYCH